MRKFRLFWLSALCFAVSACAPDAERAQAEPASGPNVAVVTQLMAAFNKQDPDAMRAFWHDDVVWIEISGDQTSVVTASAQQLYDELTVYFQSYPSVRSSLENISVNGNYLTAVERPVWEEKGERQSQASIVVYEFEDEKIKRFWYYPPQ